jgi:hypothetical protein
MHGVVDNSIIDFEVGNGHVLVAAYSLRLRQEAKSVAYLSSSFLQLLNPVFIAE